MSEQKNFISVVIPVYNEEDNLPLLNRKLKDELGRYDSYEIIYVNDGSNDNSASIIQYFCQENSSIKLLNLSRNFGHQPAISAGMQKAVGDAVIVMDADLQDPPEFIHSLIDSWKTGYDVVYAIRTERKENPIKKLAYFAFYRFLEKISDIKIPLDTGDFSLIDRKVVDHINKLPEKNRFIRGLRSWLGFKQTGIKYKRCSRNAGKPKYNIYKLCKLAFDGIFSTSYKPLKLSTNLGLFVMMLSFIGILIVLYFKIFTDKSVPGFASTMSVLLFINGIQFLIIGILGEYIGRIYDEVKQRPNFIIESSVNIIEKDLK